MMVLGCTFCAPIPACPHPRSHLYSAHLPRHRQDVEAGPGDGAGGRTLYLRPKSLILSSR